MWPVTLKFRPYKLITQPTDTTKRYCPPYSAANKSRLPKHDKRVKNILEVNQKKRKKSIVKTMATELKIKEEEGKE